MTSEVIRNNGMFIAIIISCDEQDCSRKLSDSSIADGGGLNKLGWTVYPQANHLQHFCPEHSHENLP